MIVTLSAEAERDLEAIGDYIARDDPARALTFLQQLRAKCLGLADFPERFPPEHRAEKWEPVFRKNDATTKAQSELGDSQFTQLALVPRYERHGVRHRVHGNYLIFYRV